MAGTRTTPLPGCSRCGSHRAAGRATMVVGCVPDPIVGQLSFDGLAAHVAGVFGRRIVAAVALFAHAPALALGAMAPASTTHRMGCGTADVFPHLLRLDAPVVVRVVAEPGLTGCGQCAGQLGTPRLAFCSSYCDIGSCRLACVQAHEHEHKWAVAGLAQASVRAGHILSATCGGRCGSIRHILASHDIGGRVSQRQLHPRQGVARLLHGRQWAGRVSGLLRLRRDCTAPRPERCRD